LLTLLDEVIFLRHEKSDKTLMAQIAERILPYDSAVFFVQM